MGARAILQEPLTITGTVSNGGNVTFTPWSELGGRIEEYLLDCGNYSDAVITVYVSAAETANNDDTIGLCLVTSDSVDTIKLGGVEDAGTGTDQNGGTWNVHTWDALVGSSESTVRNRWVKYASEFATADDDTTDHPIDRYLTWVLDVNGGATGGDFSITFSISVTLKTPA